MRNWRWRYRKNCWIGLEMAQENLRFSVIEKQKNSWRLIHSGASALIDTDTQTILRSIRQQIPRAINQVIIGIPYSQIRMKEIRVDANLRSHEIYLHLQQQASQLFGNSDNQWYLDFEPSAISTVHQQQITLRAIAAPQTLIKTWINECLQSGFSVRVVDVDILALARILPHISAYHPDQPQALFWLKKTEFIFIVAQGGNLLYVKRAALNSAMEISANLQQATQFFYSLYPQHSLVNALLLDETGEFDHDILKISHAGFLELHPLQLNKHTWQYSTDALLPQQFCSLGLGVWSDVN